MDRVKQFWIAVVCLLVVLFLVVVAFFVILLVTFNINPTSPVDSSTINGVLTAITIVFSFVSYEAREIKAPRVKLFFISVLAIFLLITTDYYFVTVMLLGQANKGVLFIAMCNLVFNVFCSLVVMRAKEIFDEEEDKLP